MGVVIVLTNFPEFSVAGKLCRFDGGENVRALDYSVLHHAAERFISAMVLSGVLNDIVNCVAQPWNSAQPGCPPS